MERYDRDRLAAIKDVLADAFVEPFDNRDARQCAYRVLADILAREELSTSEDQVMGASGVDAARQHYARIDRLERTYRAKLALVPPEGGAAPETSPVDFDELSRAVTSEFGESVRISPVKLSPGGYSKVTIFANMERAGSCIEVVVRVDVGAGVSGTSVLDEYPILRALSDAGVTVPRPFWAGPLGSNAVGVMVVESVKGIAQGSPISSNIRDEKLCGALGSHLARLHAVPVSVVGGCLSVVETKAQILGEIEKSRDMLRRTGAASPMHDYAFEWLEANIDCVENERVIVHGDYGPHNLLVAHSDVAAILDWELVKIGHPAEDLCWSRLSVEAMGSWDIFLDAYIRAGGCRPTDVELHYFSVLSLARVSVMQLQIDLAFGTGAATLIRWAAPGIERLRPTLLRLGAMLRLGGPGEFEPGSDSAAQERV